ncbi:4Fe-4S binding protein [Humisphaera borealis]|uniref:4Fe-4S binding protein n=1 Tax=Humisphaera borealis TaxID=2807512 RepID=A0A7M2WYG7_9BACT|nr:4Fe-4S binding protein [Humisphaera borealis]QOV90404.1 4Fe-4S binding protein [Humisphaera borealis]
MPQLKVIQPSEPPTRAGPPAGSPSSRAAVGSRWKPWATRLYRLAVIVAIVWLVHDLRSAVQRRNGIPIKVEEVRPFLNAAASLERDDSPRSGQYVLDAAGSRVGYALRTSPVTDKITGYVGPTDTLVVLDPQWKVVGLRIRSSQDTKEHVGDVANDEYFMTYWNGKSWDEVAKISPKEMRVEGTSGASLTSLAIAEGLHLRFKKASAEMSTAPQVPSLSWDNATPASVWQTGTAAIASIHWRWDDLGLVLVILVSLAFAFTPLKSVPWARRVFQVVLIGYFGLMNGQILAQSLLSGWMASAIPWRVAPGLILLAAAALVIPWATRRQVYCSHICPHGAAQELAGRLSKTKLHLPKSLDRSLRWLPALLIVAVLFVTMLGLPFELAGIEPFDAYLIKTAGVATIAVAIAGLIAAVFVPMAYCKYGCPTGMVLNFVRSHGKADHFGRRDLAAGLMVLFVVGVYIKHDQIDLAIRGEPPVFKQPSTNIKGMEKT